MTAQISITNSSNWTTDEIVIEKGPTGARKRLLLRRGETTDIPVPSGDDEEARTIRFHSSTGDGKPVYAGTPQVTVTDRAANVNHPRKIAQ